MTRIWPISLTEDEWKAVMWCIGNFTDGNARDVDEMMACGLSRDDCKALLRAEAKLDKAWRP